VATQADVPKNVN